MSYKHDDSFQANVDTFMLQCFPRDVIDSRPERCERFIEESLELVQAAGLPKYVVHALVEYVYSRPKGDIPQEIGGTMVTLAAFCNTFRYNMNQCAVQELERAFKAIPAIQAKAKTKPKLHTEGDAQ